MLSVEEYFKEDYSVIDKSIDFSLIEEGDIIKFESKFEYEGRRFVISANHTKDEISKHGFDKLKYLFLRVAKSAKNRKMREMDREISNEQTTNS